MARGDVVRIAAATQHHPDAGAVARFRGGRRATITYEAYASGIVSAAHGARVLAVESFPLRCLGEYAHNGAEKDQSDHDALKAGKEIREMRNK